MQVGHGEIANQTTKIGVVFIVIGIIAYCLPLFDNGFEHFLRE